VKDGKSIRTLSTDLNLAQQPALTLDRVVIKWQDIESLTCMFAYMEYYPWFLRTFDEDARLRLDSFIRHCGASSNLWIGLNLIQSGPKSQPLLRS
jgi:hypothetical protein